MIDRVMRDELFRVYNEYVTSFEKDGALDAMSLLKVEHSKRVAGNAKLIAEYNGFSESEIILAEVCGLFHDIGRYRQLQKFGTFKDAESVNHGKCGYNVLLEMDWLNDLPSVARECILTSTRFHNAKDISDSLTDDTVLTFLKLVRDSDKIDIYYVFYDAIKNGNLSKYPELVHNLELEMSATESLVDSMLKDPKTTISYSDARCMADFLLIPMQWSYELHSFGSYKIMSERRLLEKMCEIMPDLHNDKIVRIMDNAISNVERSLENYLR